MGSVRVEKTENIQRMGREEQRRQTRDREWVEKCRAETKKRKGGQRR